MRAVTGFRLRSLSERGRFDRGCRDHRWMLKRVPGWGDEWVWVALSASGRLQPAAGRFLLLAACRAMPIFFLWEAHPAPMNSAPIAASAPHQPINPVVPGSRRRRLQAPTALPRSRPGDRSYATGRASSPCPPPGKNTARNQAPTSPHRPTLEPASASPNRPVQAQSRRPRSDKDRSRNLVVTRKPRDHSARARRSRNKTRCHTPNPQTGSDPHLGNL